MQYMWKHKEITNYTKYAVELNWHGDLFMNGENLLGKNPIEWF